MNCPSCQKTNDDSAPACWSCGHSLGSLPVLSPGTLVAGRYEIADALGRGGMGTVYRAHDRMLDEPVAIKVLRAEPENAADRGRRFRSEIKLARKVTHRNVCRIHEYGEDGPLRYICMELVEGTDLKRLVDRRGRLPAREAFDLAIQVAAGLEAIHQVGVIHRDLKPSNIMLDGQGAVKLMDFGIAKQWAKEGDSGATGTGTIVGTPDYMSPEQARGERIDFRSDVYCLGVVTYELFTGVRPFKATTPLGTILKHLNEPAPLSGPLASRIPAPVLPLLEKALAKDREARYATAGAMLEALQEASAAFAALPEAKLTSHADPLAEREATTFTSAASSPLPTRRKRRWPAAVLAAAAIGAVAAMILNRRPAEEPLTQAPQTAGVRAPAPSLAAATEPTTTTTLPRSQAVPAPKPTVPSKPTPASNLPETAAAPATDLAPTAPPDTVPSTTLTTLPAQPSDGPPTTTAPPAVEHPAVADPGNAPPVYPRDARAKGLEGQVTLKIAVSETGKVGEIAVLSGEEPFVAAAVDAVRLWRYSPATRDGRSAPSDVIVRIPFRLTRKR